MILCLIVLYGVVSTSKNHRFVALALIILLVVSMFSGRYLFDYLNLPVLRNSVLNDLVARAPID